MTENKLDEIWKGDLFSRREEAENLEAYIESVWKRPNLREDSQGFVMAIDADYGMGKTFFLKKFAEQMALNHPVAYIDAWRDDLQDEPLIALIATLEAALNEAFGGIEGELAKAKTDLWDKFRKITGIVGKGLLKKGAGLIITASGAEAVSTILEGQDQDLKETVDRELEGIGDDAVNGIVSISKVIGNSGNLEERLKSFKEGQTAIGDLKKALSSLVEVIATDGKQAPIVIIIDELDRCRPNYAIKLLEEIKHLFDVAGVVFILGTNLEQLALSVSVHYGEKFDGRTYLNRFIERKYSLKKPELRNLTRLLMDTTRFPQDVLDVLQTYNEGDTSRNSHLSKNILTDIVDVFDFSPREFFKLFELLLTSQAMIKGCRILIPYFIPLAIKINWPEKFERAAAQNWPRIKIAIPKIGSEENVSILDFFNTTQDYLDGKFVDAKPDENSPQSSILDFLEKVAFKTSTYDSYHRFGGLAHPRNYQQLINFIQRYEINENE